LIIRSIIARYDLGGLRAGRDALHERCARNRFDRQAMPRATGHAPLERRGRRHGAGAPWRTASCHMAL